MSECTVYAPAREFKAATAVGTLADIERRTGPQNGFNASDVAALDTFMGVMAGAHLAEAKRGFVDTGLATPAEFQQLTGAMATLITGQMAAVDARNGVPMAAAAPAPVPAATNNGAMDTSS